MAKATKTAKKPTAKRAPKRKAAPSRKAAPKRKPAPKKAAPKRTPAPAPRKRPRAAPARALDAIPVPIDDGASADTLTGRRRAKTAREWASRSSPVVEILDDAHPVGALRRFLDSVRGIATPLQAQIALGSAQLMLLPIAREQRGGHDVKEVVDLVLERWVDLGERRIGFHAREFLRNAFAAIGVDRHRIAKLEAVVPGDAGPDLLFSVACAHAVARDKVAMLRAVEAALDAGCSTTQLRRDSEFAAYQTDPDFVAVLARAELPPIPVDVESHVGVVRAALDALVGTLREFGEQVELRPPVRLDAILDAERARKISLPNDYRALLAITNGMRVKDHASGRDLRFFGVGDYAEATPLAVMANRFMQVTGDPGLAHCVPLAYWGHPDDWLLYDRHGVIRGDQPGYVLYLGQAIATSQQLDGLAGVFARIEWFTREVLGTN